MPDTITVNNLSISHKGSTGVSTATLPDVCKTPSPAGPVPVPYPNVTMSNMLMQGTTTVKVDGNMAAIKGSKYSISTGDEPGVAGGVKSSVFKMESTWITYSFDVKMEGKNVCRLTDKKFHNRENTVNLAGDVEPPPTPPAKDPEDMDCEELAAAINLILNAKSKEAAGSLGSQGLRKRRAQQIHGAHGPGSDSWVNHENVMRGNQRKLQRYIAEYDKKGCDPEKLPEGARKEAYRPLPHPNEHIGRD
jgi:uncharacterized Zn-binding protein involved in type VI secretion